MPRNTISHLFAAVAAAIAYAMSYSFAMWATNDLVSMSWFFSEPDPYVFEYDTGIPFVWTLVAHGIASAVAFFACRKAIHIQKPLDQHTAEELAE